MPLFTRETPAIPVRGIHLDLKGLPPTTERLLQLPQLLAACRINCVLVEWEDTYPWHCYEELRCETAYSDETIAAFLKACADVCIEVIPLLQSFGHMQNVLVHDRFAHLREVEGGTADVCPSKSGSVALVVEMIDDILESHRGITRIHLGGDEVGSLGSCDECRKVVESEGKDGLYLKHIGPLLEHVVSHGVRPILWDDMMREWPEGALSELGDRADLMCWAYRANPFERVTPEVMDRFARAGVTMWAASAFKGADGCDVDVPKPEVRRANMAAWVREAAARSMAGVVATGWSRYTTFLVPCEGLEASVDMVALAGAVSWDGAADCVSDEEIDSLLTRGPCAELAGERFIACRTASRQLGEWHGSEWPFRHLLNHAAVAGEPERLDRAELRGLLNRERQYIADGVRLTEAWKRAHAGLVENVWIDRYCAARLNRARAVIEPWLARTEEELRDRV